MIESPFRFEPDLTEIEYAKLGVLALRWSHIEHILGNCIKVMMRLTDDEAVIAVFPLKLEARIKRIADLAAITPLSQHGDKAFRDLRAVMKGLQSVRNNVIHAVVAEHDTEGHVFHLRSKMKSLTKAQVFSVEELTNYAAHLVLSLRYSLGFKDGEGPTERPFPDRPPIPEFLRSTIQWPKPG